MPLGKDCQMRFLVQTDPSPMLDSLSLGSITGVVAATMLVVEILKRIFDNVTGFKKIPVFVYAIVVAAILAFIGNKLGYLAGKPVFVIWASIISAGSASGFYTWLRNPQPIQTASKVGVIPSILLFGFCFSSIGCTNGFNWNKRAPNDTPVTNDARIVYSSIVSELTTLKKFGYISNDEKVNQIEPIRKQAADALNALETAELSGLKLDKTTFNNLIDKLIEWRTKAQARKSVNEKVSWWIENTISKPMVNGYSRYGRVIGWHVVIAA